MGGFVNFTTRIAPESIVAGSVVDYSLATAYTTGQIVNYNGALWTATANSTGQAPAAGSAYWEITNASQQAPKGGAILNGTTQYYSHPDNANLNFGTGDFSIEWYGYLSTSSSYALMVSKIKDTTPFSGFQLRKTSDNEISLRYFVVGGTNENDFKTGAITSGYYHIIATVSSSGTLNNIYINSIDKVFATVVNTYDGTSLSNSGDIGLGAGSINGTYGSFLNGIHIFQKLHNHALTQQEVTERWNNGQPHLFVEPYETRDASQTDLLSGWDFTSGWTENAGTIINATSFSTAGNGGIFIENKLLPNKKYKLVVALSTTASSASVYDSAADPKVIIGDNGTYTFTVNGGSDGRVYLRNVGAGTTTVTILSLVPQGSTFSALPQDAGTNGWKVKVGGVTSIMNSTASPIATSKGAYEVYTDARATIATATPTTMTIPKGYVIKEIRALGSASLTAIKIGTSSGGEQIVQSTTTTGTTPKILTLASTAKATYSESADTTIYVQHTTAGQTMNVILIFEKVGA